MVAGSDGVQVIPAFFDILVCRVGGFADLLAYAASVAAGDPVDVTTPVGSSAPTVRS